MQNDHTVQQGNVAGCEKNGSSSGNHEHTTVMHPAHQPDAKGAPPVRWRAQLQMRWPADQPVVIPPLADRFVVRTLEPGDEEGYLRMMRAASMGGDWNIGNLKERVLDRIVNRGLFLALSMDSGVVAGSASAVHCPSPRHPHGGELGWVGVDPAFRGHNLGAVVSAAATRHLIENGYDDIFLTTDDPRLPAIKTYLRLSWQPVIFDNEHEQRWKDACASVGISYSSCSIVDKRGQPSGG